MSGSLSRDVATSPLSSLLENSTMVLYLRDESNRADEVADDADNILFASGLVYGILINKLSELLFI